MSNPWLRCNSSCLLCADSKRGGRGRDRGYSGREALPSSHNVCTDPRPDQRLERRLRSRSLQKSQIERREYQDDPDVHHQALPEPMPEEQDVHADYDGYQREHVKHNACLPSHYSTILFTTASSPRMTPPSVSGFLNNLIWRNSSGRQSALLKLLVRSGCGP